MLVLRGYIAETLAEWHPPEAGASQESRSVRLQPRVKRAVVDESAHRLQETGRAEEAGTRGKSSLAKFSVIVRGESK